MKSENLNVVLGQFNPVWEDYQTNLNRLDTILETIPSTTDLICLPEMFATGFSMRTEAISQPMNGPIVSWMKDAAKRLKMAILGSVSIKEVDHYFNRMVFVDADGNITTYDKKHLFSLAKEQNHYASGNEKVIVNLKGWRLCLQICYDLRFPAFVRYDNDYDAIVYVASWPNPRIFAWNQLLIARAIENMAYVIGVNRVGEDPNENQYSGCSVVLNPLGETVGQTKENIEEFLSVSISMNDLNQLRNRFGFLEDRDRITVI